MKKYLLFVLALAVALSMSAPVMAKDGLSVGLGFGLKANLNNLGDTIADDGLDGAETRAFFDKAVADEKTLMVVEDLGYIKSLKTSGAMSGLDFALNARYDFMGYFFGRIGFNYTMKVMGGDTEWKYTAAAASAVETALVAGGLPGALGPYATAGIAGFKSYQKWESSGWQIPFTVGINLPALDGKVNIYAGLGLAISQAAWSLEIKDLNMLLSASDYVTVYATAVATAGGDPTAAGPVAAAKATTTQKVEFSYLGIAPMYVIGVDAQVAENVNAFLEWETVLGMGYSDVESVKTTYGQIALGSTKLAYPVVTGGMILRIGAKYTLGGIF